MSNLRKVYCRHIPAKGYQAVTILCWMVIRSEWRNRLPQWIENHESVHYAQEKELGFILFYLIYALEYLIKLAITRNHLRAYYSVSFEQEAYMHQYDRSYLNNRIHYVWTNNIFKLWQRK